MTRDEAIEAGARAIWGRTNCFGAPTFDEAAAEQWQLIRIIREDVASVLDAVGWAEPVGYVIAWEHRETPGALYPSTWPDLASALAWAEPSERVWGLVPVEVAE